MPGKDVKVDKGRGSRESYNLHLSDEKCRFCGSNLPKMEHNTTLRDRHSTCINKAIRILLSQD